MAASLLETRTTDGQVTSCGATPRLASFRVGALHTDSRHRLGRDGGTAAQANTAATCCCATPPDFYRDGGHMSDSAG